MLINTKFSSDLIKTIYKDNSLKFYFKFEDLNIINEYNLKVFFISDISTKNIELTSTANILDNKYEFVIDTTTTNTFNIGEYKVFYVLDNGTDKYTFDSSFKVNVLNSILNLTYEKSHNRKVLDALKATIEKKATYDQMSYSFNGISISRLEPEKLLYWKQQYELLVQKEEEEEKSKAGLVSKKLNKIKIKFV